MPLLTLDITSPPLSAAQRTQIQQGLTQLMVDVLNKVEGLTVVHLREQGTPSAWSVAGRPLSAGDWCASLHVLITEGSNNAMQQHTFLAAAHALLQTTLGQAPAAPLYIVVDNVPAGHWGYGGRTQASRQAPRHVLPPPTIRQLSGVIAPETWPARGTALLLLDFQREYAADGRLPLEGFGAAAHEADQLSQAADACGVPVVHVHHVSTTPHAALFDSDGPGIAPNPKPVVGPRHLRVVKHWPSAFHETSLLQTLREQGVHTVVLAGCMTHNCVDSTARHALHLGLQVVVATNACATRALPANDGGTIAASDVHRSTLAALADRHATVTEASAVVAGWLHTGASVATP